MNHFELRDGVMHAEGVSLEAIAAEVGTPAYVYSAATLRRHARVLRGALDGHAETTCALIAFAVKANSNLSVLKVLAGEGLGADTVSAPSPSPASTLSTDRLELAFTAKAIRASFVSG